MISFTLFILVVTIIC